MKVRTLLGTAALSFPAVAVVALALVTSPRWGSACAVAPPDNHPVAIADESAIIVWDAATKTQHFIRRASFNTEAPDFGFLVPTPSRPALAEADDKAFEQLALITAPRVIQQAAPAPESSCGCADLGLKSAYVTGAV